MGEGPFQKLRLLDLFSGIGGFSLGLERSGLCETVAFCEIEPFCRRVLAKHWPEVPCFDDVRTLSAERLRRDGIAVDAICGGFPCQDISSAGRRAGIGGELSGLWKEYARIIGELRPRIVVVENSSDLLFRGMGVVLGDLAEVGYDAEWHCIPAAAVGADHERDRIWIIAYPYGTGDQSLHELWRLSCSPEVGEDAPTNDAHYLRARLARGIETRKIGEDARAISARLGLAISSAPAFPGIDGSGSPVLGRGENGIPDRVDRMHAIGNAVVPQIPELIGLAIKEALMKDSSHA